VHGRVHILADNGQVREEFILDRPNVGLHLPPMIWGVQYRFSPGAVLLVLCSDLYDPGDYIRDYSSFLAERRLATKAHE
jgi:UDP-2-acetamido-3-amino-2,3-dideoxy-glucuronate N-acetyltransferase